MDKTGTVICVYLEKKYPNRKLIVKFYETGWDESLGGMEYFPHYTIGIKTNNIGCYIRLREKDFWDIHKLIPAVDKLLEHFDEDVKERK